MKKNFQKFAAIAFAATALSISFNACDDGTNTIDPNAETLTDEQALALADNALFEYYHKAFGLSFIVETFTSKTHSFEGEESEDGPLISRHELSPTNVYFVNRWYNKNSAVANANEAIEKITSATGISEDAKKVAIARAKLARALGYHVLVRLWGEVPLYTTSDGDTKTRASIDDIYTQIVKDLEEAAEDLPTTGALPSVPTKAAAYGLLSRVYLDWGSNPLTYDKLNAIANSTTDPAPTYTTSRLEEAVKYANKVTGYQLNSEFSTIWGKANEAAKDEKILTFVHDGDAEGTGNHQTHCSWTFGFNVIQENHLSPAQDSFLAAWDEKDSRRNVSYIDALYDDVGDSIAYFRAPVTLPRYGKFVDQTSEGPNETYKLNDLDRVELRYAEVLLNKAEALVLLGRASEAKDPINQLRRRAFGDTKHDLSSVTLDDVKAEWGYEFVYEQKEWFNLTRWKNVIKDLESVRNNEYFDDSYAVAGNIGRNGSVVNAFFAKTYRHLHAKYNNREAKYYRFPIPVGKSGENLGITPQNPGY
jgi:tetratricopeptide (TPR) repeat protein